LAKYPDLRLSINISARSIGYGQWVDILGRALRRDSSIADRLILEITESSAMLMPELVMHFMCDLRQRRITFALDDFGAGTTSFRYSRDFAFDIVKIDGQFTKKWPLTLTINILFNHLDRFLTTLVCSQLPKLSNANVTVSG
jgi:EAL domain-containing protein (putative c-di-GMP-specific phosphodiesterase class I)